MKKEKPTLLKKPQKLYLTGKKLNIKIKGKDLINNKTIIKHF